MQRFTERIIPSEINQISENLTLMDSLETLPDKYSHQKMKILKILLSCTIKKLLPTQTVDL